MFYLAASWERGLLLASGIDAAEVRNLDVGLSVRSASSRVPVPHDDAVRRDRRRPAGRAAGGVTPPLRGWP